MSEILRYVLVDKDDTEQDYEYADYRDAEDAARKDRMAVISRTYVYDDSELVWTPDGSSIWPPEETESSTS